MVPTRRSFWRIVALAAALALACLPASARSDGAAKNAAVSVVSAAQLPPEARHTLALIRNGGPFPYERDGVTFGNFERLLPRRERGYYREYTVRTPGIAHRGARRIVAGRAGELYYTEDHYRSFSRIRE